MFRFKSAVQRGVRAVNSVRSMSNFSEFKDSRTKGPITFWSLSFMTITGCGLVAMFYIEKDRLEKARAKNIRSVGKPALGGPWILVDQDGHPRTDASYNGKFRLLYFGFTYCPDICPSELVKIGNIVKAVGNHSTFQFLSFHSPFLMFFILLCREAAQARPTANLHLRGP
jgi:hypothetical protein